jgi:hypothetical protein
MRKPRTGSFMDHGVTVAVPHLPPGLSGGARRRALRALIDGLMTREGMDRFVLWYYTPAALAFTHISRRWRSSSIAWTNWLRSRVRSRNRPRSSSGCSTARTRCWYGRIRHRTHTPRAIAGARGYLSVGRLVPKEGTRRQTVQGDGDVATSARPYDRGWMT